SASVEPGIEADTGALRQVLRKPCAGLGLRDLYDLEDGRIHLIGRLERIAPIHEQSGFAGSDDGEAGRTVEAREPRQTLGGGWHILAHVLVGSRDENGFDA